MQTLDVRIKVTRAVIRESGEFDTGGSDGSYGSDRGENGCSVYDNITVRDNITMNDSITVRDASQDNDSWQYTTRIPQVNISNTLPLEMKVKLHMREKRQFKTRFEIRFEKVHQPIFVAA